MGALFDQDRAFWRYLNKFADMVILNVVFLICCLPIVTIGPAYTAMYYATVKTIRKGRGYLMRNFFHSFKQNLLQGIAGWMIFLVFISGSALSMYMLWDKATQGGSNQLMFWLVAIIALFLVCMMLYFFPVLSRFSFSFPNYFVFSYLMAVRFFIYTVLLLAMFAGCIFLSYICIPFLIIIGPALYTMLSSFLIEKVFAVYMPRFEAPTESSSDDGDDDGELKYLGPAANRESETKEETGETETKNKDQWYYD